MGKKTNIALGAAAIVVGYAIVVAASNITAQPTFVAGQMPACDSDVTKQLLQSAIEEAPVATQSGLTISSIGKAQTFEVPGFVQGSNGKWLCRAMVFTNAGKLEAGFHIEWANEAKDEIWLEVGALEANPFSPLN